MLPSPEESIVMPDDGVDGPPGDLGTPWPKGAVRFRLGGRDGGGIEGGPPAC